MALKNYYTELLLLLCMAVVTPGTAQKKAIDSIQSLMESPRGDQLPNDSRMKNYLKLSEQTVRFNTAQALNYGKKALAAAKAIPNHLGEAMSLNMIGNAYSNTSNFDSARFYYDSSFSILNQLHDTTGIIQVINNLGILAKLEGNYKLAIQYYKESYKIASACHDTVGMVLTTNNIGIVYYDWKQYDVALEHYQKALAMLRKQGDSTRMAVLLNNAGELLKETGKPDKALANYFESLKISLKRGMRMTSMNSYINIGDVYLARKEYDSARKNFQHALGLSQAIQYPFGLAMSHIRLGEALMMLNNDATAFQHLSTGAALARQQNDLVLKRDASLNLYRYHQKQGQYKEALSTFHDYTAARDSLFNQNSRKEMAILRTEYETDKKENEIKLLTQEKAIQMLEVERHKNLFLYTLLIAISLLLAGWLAYTRFRLKQKNIKNELEKLNLEIEQRLLRSQMSPHFIFNSLNSINSFIAENNSRTAQTFLTKFAELIRLILENSRKTLTSLADELRTLQLYLEIEQMRFDKKFTFILESDETLDPDNTYIPPMLVQPFVENALLHGIAHSNHHGLVVISFEQRQDTMMVTVTDNGIGRTRSAEIETKPTHRQSLGMQLTSERLQLLGSQFGGQYTAEISDITNEKGTCAGTHVAITMPFETE